MNVSMVDDYRHPYPTWSTGTSNTTIRFPQIASLTPLSAEQEGELDAMKQAMIVSKIDALERRIAELEERLK